MWSKSRNLILLLVCVLGLSARAFAAATATITVGGSEQQVSGVWDTTSITISFNGYTETVSPGQFSTTASVASAFAAQFSRDYAHAGLSAQVVCGSSSSLITFALGGTAIFGPVSVIGSTTSFQMSPAGFLSATSQVYDTGTITLTVGGVTAATTSYVANATPSTIASGLAAGVTVGSFVNVTAVNDGLYLVAKQAGAGTNYSYSIQDTSSNPAVFTQPSFGSAPGNLDGGANAGVAGQAQPIYSFNGAYDGVGNLISYTDSAMGNWGFSYDSLNRLKTGNPSSGTYNGQHICWAYDGFGNRTAESLQTTACPTSETSVTATAVYNNSNQIKSAAGIGSASGYTFSSTFSYDDSGDVTNDTTNKYLYDAEGRICAVQDIKFGGAITGYIYGPDGTRVSKGTITSWSCDPSANGFTPSSDYILGTSNEQLTELDINASQGAMTWQHTNVWAGGTLMATYDNDGLHFYFDDPLGTRRAQTDYAGVLQQTCQSLPFGNAETCAATPTEHLFTGKERDGESGNDYFGARYYASSIGRFMSPDWSAKAEPVPYAKLGDPQTLNLYGYMQNNPLGGVDQDGHCPNAFALGCNAFDNLEGDEENSANQSTPPPSAQQQPAQQQGQFQWKGDQSGGIISDTGGGLGTVKKWFDFGKAAKDTLDAKSWYDYWGRLQQQHLMRLTRDESGSQYADSLHIGVDHAQLKLDEAEMGYYGTKGLLTAGGATGYIMIPKLGDGVLDGLQLQVGIAAQNLASETAAYNQVTAH